MSNTFEDFQTGWNKSKETMHPNPTKLDDLISSAKSRKKSNLVFHYGNVVVLLFTAMVLIIVWRLWMPFQEVISIIGISIMIGGLFLRIVLELVSAIRSGKINLVDNTRENNNEMIRFYQFRKAMHGPVTISIVIAYLAGFAMVLPELSKYVSSLLLVIFTTAFLLSGGFIIYKVRQSIKKEMDNLRFFLSIREQLEDSI